ncbi:MAG TPA: biopolymer transporter ExbD [Polyangiaceae bacterium]|nr:biopolymer transporter ExbD [Polyangiaceae bacterium]
MTQTKVAGKGQATPNINVTPLVDVVLVVLIIFMILTITMSKTFSLHLPPKDDTAKDEPKPASGENQPVVMTVDASGVIRVNQTIVPKSELRERLPRMLAGANQRVLYFDAHDDSPFGSAMEALDLSRASGVRNIAVLTEKVVR